ncbi:MAG: helix-turn-helix transcriptional regulator [Clostridiales bacterium]|jgi:DNA-binding PadR family transcriptional regulator|nr:helix-turn-helix transcriptional regulator [Clostridiales bacterium]
MKDNVKSGALTEVTFFILLSLYEPKHGYAIMQFIDEKTSGRLLLGAGSLYGAINTLTEKGWIKPYGDSDGRKKEYVITAEGRRIAEKELRRLRELTKTAETIIES